MSVHIEIALKILYSGQAFAFPRTGREQQLCVPAAAVILQVAPGAKGQVPD